MADHIIKYSGVDRPLGLWRLATACIALATENPLYRGSLTLPKALSVKYDTAGTMRNSHSQLIASSLHDRSQAGCQISAM